MQIIFPQLTNYTFEKKNLWKLAGVAYGKNKAVHIKPQIDSSN